MIFAVQRNLEEWFRARGLEDSDHYAARLAYAYSLVTRDQDFAKTARRIRTSFYRTNRGLVRTKFESQTAARLQKYFVKNQAPAQPVYFPAGLGKPAARIRRLPRLSISSLLREFQHSFEAQAVDSLWASRTKGQLHLRPEKIAQQVFGVFLDATLRGRPGFFVREAASGIGFIDVVVALGRTPHLVELKIIRDKFLGSKQLSTYMKQQRRTTGWLVAFDARPAKKRLPIPTVVTTSAGTIRVFQIDVNPTAPSRQ